MGCWPLQPRLHIVTGRWDALTGMDIAGSGLESRFVDRRTCLTRKTSNVPVAVDLALAASIQGECQIQNRYSETYICECPLSSDTGTRARRDVMRTSEPEHRVRLAGLRIPVITTAHAGHDQRRGVMPFDGGMRVFLWPRGLPAPWLPTLPPPAADPVAPEPLVPPPPGPAPVPPVPPAPAAPAPAPPAPPAPPPPPCANPGAAQANAKAAAVIKVRTIFRMVQLLLSVEVH